MKVIAVVQARLGSTRLPGKVLAEIAGRPMLDHVLERVHWIAGIDLVVLTTPIEDLPTISSAVEGFNRIQWQPHHPPDVLSAFAISARLHRANLIIRITADCPLLDPDLCRPMISAIEAVTESHHTFEEFHDVVYVHNTLKSSFGLDCEVFTRGALDRAAEAAEGVDREHVTSWMARNLPMITVPLDESVRTIHWAVDTPEDLARVRAIFAHLRPGDFSWQATLRAAKEAGI